MKTTVYFDDFRRAFDNAGRGNQFSLAGLGVLFDYLEQYEQDTGEDIELDVIALCCDFSEDAAGDIFNTYSIECYEDEPTQEDITDAVREYLEQNTSLCGEYEAEGETFFVYATF